MSDTLFTLNADDVCYEAPENYQPDDSVSSILKNALPDNWTVRHHGIWLIAEPPVAQNLLEHGYKLHISARPEYREHLIRTTAEIAADVNATFKCLCDFNIWTKLHDKPYASESLASYGKAITIYPERQNFIDIAQKLAAELESHGFSGPDLITDTPVLNSTNVYYRYGRILSKHDSEIDDDDTNQTPANTNQTPAKWILPALSPDTHTPEDEAPHLIDEFEVKHAETSAAGGIYIAEKDGKTVVIKEANEDTCVDKNGMDSVDRLRHELTILQKLADVNIAATPIESFLFWRNVYVVMQHLPGIPLTKLHRQPITLHTRLQIATGVAEAVAILHEHGIIWGDVSPANVLWDGNTNKVHLLDFEHARLEEKPKSTPGFTVDIRRLGFLLLYIFAPVNSKMFDLDPTAPHRFLKAMEGRLPKKLIITIENALHPEITHTTVKRVTKTLRAIQPQDIPKTDVSDNEIPINTYRKTLDDILTFITAHLTFDRQDRLLPCSPDGFLFPLSLAYGAAGLARNMQILGEDDLTEKAVDWIKAHPDFSDEQKLAATPGYWSGTAGIATTLAKFGDTDTARTLMEIATKNIHDELNLNRYDGIAGIADAALTLYYKDTNDDFYLSTAKHLAEKIIAQSVEADTGYDPTRIWKDPDDNTVYLGYLFGVTGIADFLIRLAAHLETDQKHYYADIAERALLWVEKQTFVTEDRRSLTPITTEDDTYAMNLAHGNAGVAKAFLSARQHFGSDKDVLIRKLLLPDTHIPAFAHTPAPGYFYGLAGIGSVLLDAFTITGETSYLTHAHSILEDLFCFQIVCKEGYAFPGGESLKRLSCDQATGSLGIADFLHRFLTVGGVETPTLNL